MEERCHRKGSRRQPLGQEDTPLWCFLLHLSFLIRNYGNTSRKKASLPPSHAAKKKKVQLLFGSHPALCLTEVSIWGVGVGSKNTEGLSFSLYYLSTDFRWKPAGEQEGNANSLNIGSAAHGARSNVAFLDIHP